MSERPSRDPWNHDDPNDLPIIEERLENLLLRIAAEAPQRKIPTVAMAQHWHREVHQGLHIPVPYYAGEIRESDDRFPCLTGYEVSVGRAHGVLSTNVPAELAFFESAMQTVTENIDGEILPDRAPDDIGDLQAVIALCAAAHGEWIRIHPFANGNGRTARLWANWCALRYGLPPFIRLRPRPSHPSYALAAFASMSGNHGLMEIVFLDMLQNSEP